MSLSALWRLLVVLGVVAAVSTFTVTVHREPSKHAIQAGAEPSDPTYKMPGDTESACTPLANLLPSPCPGSERRIVVEKSKRILTVCIGTKRLKSYFTSLGFSPEGAKTRRDDGKTPEGTFYTCARNPKSAYGLSVQISYPGTKEAEQGFKNGTIDMRTLRQIRSAASGRRIPPQETPLGGNIFIHGGGVGQVSPDLREARIVDWTLGCIALRNEDIREVYDFAIAGTTVVILP